MEELKQKFISVQSQNIILCGPNQLNPRLYPQCHLFQCPLERSLWKTLWEKAGLPVVE